MVPADLTTEAYAALPPALRELVRVLGEADAFRLVSAHGGARISVPAMPKADHRLRACLSAEGFDALVAWAGGGVLELPKADAYVRELRHQQVRECRAEGLTVDETAERTGYTRRHVINVMGGKAGGHDTKTLDLFAEAPSPWRGIADPFGGLGR